MSTPLTPDWPTRYIAAVTVLAGLTLTGLGIWSLADPHSFGDFTGFGHHHHFLHDLGAFQIGIGATLLLAALWGDTVATALAGFLLTNTLHTLNHVVDLDLGGSAWQAWALGAVSVATAAAFWLRWRQLGWVLGKVPGTATPELAPFARQKTISLTTYRRDGGPGSSPVSIVVDGDRAYIRSFEQSLKTRRLSRDPRVELVAATGLGKPTGEPVTGRMRRLESAEDRRASGLIARKYPLLHRVVVPLTHRAGRAKFGRTVHFELLLDPRPGPAAPDRTV